MRDSSGTIAAPPSILGSVAPNAGRMSVRKLPRPALLTLAALAALSICAMQAAVVYRNTVQASGIGYLCLSLALFGCALAFWTRIPATRGTVRIRWMLITAAVFSDALGYLPSFAECVFHTVAARQLQTICFNLSEALYLLAVVLFFSGVGRSIVIVDMLQALLFAVLRFNLVYSSKTFDHFAPDHLLVGQLVALLLFLIPMVACLGAASRDELKFLRTLSWFFGLRFIGFFLSDQVSFIWLHYDQCSLWDVPGTAVFAGFALYLLYSSSTARAESPDTALLHAPSIAVRSLMPSFLALVNFAAGLLLLRVSIPLAAVAISVSLLCYMVRTVLLQAQTVQEKTQLLSRNEQLEGLATRDPLTGIGNRRSLAGVYSRLQETAGEDAVALLLMDIDHFKEANDQYGHLHGDHVLIALARRLESLSSLVPGSHCARFGGDEFAVLLPNVSSQLAAIFAEELRTGFTSHTFEMSLSIGVATLRAAHDLPLEMLVAHADDVLYRAKMNGRNRVEIYPACDASGPAGNTPAPALGPAPTEGLELHHTIG